MRFLADIFITFTFLHHVFAVIGNTKDVVCDTYVKQPSVWSCCPGEATNFKELTQNAKTTPWSKLQLKDAVYFRGIPVDENSTRTLRLCIIAPMGYRASVTVNVKAPFNTSSVGPAERETCTHPRVDIWAKNVYNSQASMDASPLNREARHTDERTRTANSKRRTRKNNTKRRPQFELRNSYSNKRTSAVLPNLQSILNSPKTDPTSTPTPNPQFRNEFPRRLRQRRGITADNSSWTRLRHFCDSELLSTAGTKFSLFREIADELDSGLNEDPRLPETDHVKEPIISILAVDINADFNDPELLHRLRQLLFHISFTKLNNGSLNIGSTLVNASLNGTVAVAVSNSELNKAITVGREEKDAGMRFLPSHMLIVIIGCFSLLALIATVACVVKRRRTRSRRTQQQQEQGIDDNESQSSQRFQECLQRLPARELPSLRVRVLKCVGDPSMSKSTTL